MMENQFSPLALRELGHRFDALTHDVREKGVRFAGRKGAKLIADAARQNARHLDDPQTAESIADNIVVRFSPGTFKRTGDVMFRVGVLGGARNYAKTRENVRKGRVGKAYKTDGDKSNKGGDTWYWRLVEFGRGPVSAKRSKFGKKKPLADAVRGVFFGDHVKEAPPHPFMRPALQENIEPTIGEFASQLNRWLDRWFSRMPKG